MPVRTSALPAGREIHPGQGVDGHSTAERTTLADDARATVSRHRDDIQGLRALAVLLVAVAHSGVSFMEGGFVGVDVFFVLSGFLITGLLLSGALKHRPAAVRAARGPLRMFSPTAAAPIVGQTRSVVEFYARRARRILPAAALTLIVTDVAAYSLLNFVRAKQVAQDSIWAALFGANIHFANLGTDYFARGQPPSPIQHFWTLGVEEQFYLVWPLLFSLVVVAVALGRRSRRKPAEAPQAGLERAARPLLLVIAVVAAGSLAWSVYDTSQHPAAAYFSTFTRAWELALGALLAIAASRLVRLPAGMRAAIGWLGVAAIIVAAVAYSSGTRFPGYAVLLPTLGAALVIAAGIATTQPRLGVGRLLAIAPLRYVGDRSYTFYLWHWPVLIIARQYEGRELSVGVNFLLLLGAFLLSIVTYRYFENPIRRGEPLLPSRGAATRLREAIHGYGLAIPRRFELKRSASFTRPLLLWPASVAAVLLVAGVIINSIENRETRDEVAAAPTYPGLAGGQAGTNTSASKGVLRAAEAGEPLPAVVAAVNAAKRDAPIPSGLKPPPSELLNEGISYRFPEGCAPATDQQTTSKVCRLGSSASSKSIVVMGDSHAQMWMPAILSMAQRDGWAVIPLVKSACNPNNWIDNTANAPCRVWYRWAVRQAKGIRPDVTLVTGAYGGATGGTAASVQNAITSFGTALERASKQVIVLGDTDGIKHQPVDCLLRNGATMGRCTVTWTRDRFALNDDLALRARTANLDYLSTRGWFCADYRCPMVIGHTIVYRDTGHITREYALQVARPFRAAFRQAIRPSGGS